MALKYLVSNTTYDFGGPQYTNIGGSKRLNYIASGKTYQLGMATDKTCSQYSPLVMKVNGTNYYIGRSQSGSYTTSDSILSTRLNTYTSGGYSTQYYTYNGGINYAGTRVTSGNGTYLGYPQHHIQSYTTEFFTSTAPIINSEKYNSPFYETAVWDFTYQSWPGYSYLVTLTSTSNVYYTTIINNGVSNTTVSTTKSASSSSHNFV